MRPMATPCCRNSRCLTRGEEADFLGQPGGEEELGQRGQEGGVLDHHRASSKAWSTRK